MVLYSGLIFGNFSYGDVQGKIGSQQCYFWEVSYAKFVYCCNHTLRAINRV